MTEQLLAVILSKLLHYLAGDAERWMAFYRQVRKLLLADNAQNAREGVLAIAKQLENCYTRDGDTNENTQ